MRCIDGSCPQIEPVVWAHLAKFNVMKDKHCFLFCLQYPQHE